MTNKELRGKSAKLSILDGSEWEYEGPGNIIYCYASMSDAQKDLLLEVVQRYDESEPPITAGTLPFFSRAKCLEYVKRYIEDEFPAWMPGGIAHLQLKKMLDTDEYWVDFTTIADGRYREFNHVTGQWRYRPFEPLGYR